MDLNKQQAIRYRILYAVLYLISLIPLRLLYAMSDMVSPLVRRCYRRKLVRRQLAEAFPEKPERDRSLIERKFYSQLCDNFVEFIKQLSLSEKSMREHMVFEGFDELAGQLNANHPISLVYLGHFGNWEWIASLTYTAKPYGVACSQVYHPLSDKVFDRLMTSVRCSYGGECIPMRKTVRRLIKANNEKHPLVCGMIADQQPRWDAIHHFTRFLNHESAVFIGTEELAKKFNSPVFYARITKVRRGYYKCRFIPMTTNPADIDNYRLTDRYMQMLEEDIRRSPELWLWTHKRWSRTKEEWLERQNKKQNRNE